ncbi:hypothetical protein [Calothrix sp. 336/3]|uniref:hypothetical protein n=1 Tax=Calothrix sp. 336/3 TaxID=1337936 RepID=UPI000AA81D2F|nr:hypothetical protein [Calothrix sp. 336/3]
MPLPMYQYFRGLVNWFAGDRIEQLRHDKALPFINNQMGGFLGANKISNNIPLFDGRSCETTRSPTIDCAYLMEMMFQKGQ